MRDMQAFHHIQVSSSSLIKVASAFSAGINAETFKQLVLVSQVPLNYKREFETVWPNTSWPPPGVSGSVGDSTVRVFISKQC